MIINLCEYQSTVLKVIIVDHKPGVYYNGP